MLKNVDVKDIKCVINYDFPTSLEDYVHRIGRTGRAGAKGIAVTFFTHSNAKHARELVKILQDAGQVVPVALSSMTRSMGPGGTLFYIKPFSYYSLSWSHVKLQGSIMICY